MAGDRRMSNVLGAEEVAGKLRQVWSDGCTIFPQTARGNPAWNLRPPYEEGQQERGDTNHLCDVLPQVTQVSKVSSTRLPRSSTQCVNTAGTFHVPKFSVSDSGGSGGKGTAALLQLMWDAHASRASHQAPMYGKIQLENLDDVAETGYGDSGKLHGCDLQPNGGGRSRMF